LRSGSSLTAVLAVVLASCGGDDIYLYDLAGPTDALQDDGGRTDPGGDPGRDAPAEGGTPDPGTDAGKDLVADPGADTTAADVASDPGGKDPGTDPGTLTCVQDDDPAIDADELPTALGAAPMFLANAAGATLDLDVEARDDGAGPYWDFTQGPADVRTRMTVGDPADYWFADRFPGAGFVSPLSAQDPSVLAVYRRDATTVYLMGVASDVENPAAGQTLVVYETPVPLFAFPLDLGRTYGTETRFRDARLYGIPNAGTEKYSIAVDARGTLLLPDFTMQNVLRLRIEVQQTLAIAPSPDPIRSVQYLWIHACVGEVARVMGPVGDLPYQGHAREFRRLGL
jgi:hypothetical protein